MAYFTEDRRSRAPAIAAVALVHVGIGYALMTGLATMIVKGLPPPITIVDSIPLPPDPPPLPPRIEQKIDKVQLPDQIGRTKTQDVVNIDLLPPIVIPNDEPVRMTPVDEAPVAPSKARPVSVGRDRAEWITTDDYPASAIRGEESGTVQIRVAIDTNGRVTGCTVTASSQSPALDAATCKLYQKRARFAPALDDAGQPAPATYTDRVRWQLPDR